ncbi:MAG: GLPGLI family protein [Bacteroidota bacterium]
MKQNTLFLFLLLIVFNVRVDAQSFHAQYIEISESAQESRLNPTILHLFFNSEKSIFYQEETSDQFYASEEKDAMGLPEDVQVSLGSEAQWLLKDMQAKQLKELLNDFKSNKIIIKDEVHPMKWKLEAESKKIGPFTAQKATTFFRGRTYEAWYTLEIPIPNGPWKMGGLPGLVIEFIDSEKIFGLRLIKIENIEDQWNIDTPNQKEYKEISPEEYNQLYFKQLDEFFKFKEAQLRSTGKDIKISYKRENYELIEIFEDQ